MQDSIKRLHVLVDGKLNELAETIRLAQAGRFEDALAHAESAEGKQLLDGIRQVLRSLDKTSILVTGGGTGLGLELCPCGVCNREARVATSRQSRGGDAKRHPHL